MTNGDVIRNMTDEEIADFLLSEESSACFHCEYYDHEIKRCYLDNPCVKGLAWVMLLEWLSSQTVYERSENPCKDCEFYMINDKDFGCGLNSPCPHNL